MRAHATATASIAIALALLALLALPRGERAAPGVSADAVERPLAHAASRPSFTRAQAPGDAPPERRRDRARDIATPPPQDAGFAAAAPALPTQRRSAPELRDAPTRAASVPGVRRDAPGSREHAQAVVAAITAEDHARTVAPIARLYLAYFARTPDYEGLRHYVAERDAGTALAEIADEFAASPEFGMRYGELDNAAFVDRIYRNVRAGADDPRRAHWVAQLDSGAMSRGEVMLAFSEENAFRTATQHAVFVAMAYAEALGRAPAAAELAQWRAFLERGGRHDEMLAALVRRRAPG